MRLVVFFSFAVCSISATITADFQSWLSQNGYSGDNFARSELGDWGSTGGKTSSGQTVKYLALQLDCKGEIVDARA
jgi:hypothetical protein